MTLYIDTKPALEWVEYNGRHMADGYEIKQTPNERWLLMWADDKNHYHDTLDLAKAAAQADYEARTAERFRKVELPTQKDTPKYESPYKLGEMNGWNRYHRDINEEIAKAKEAK